MFTHGNPGLTSKPKSVKGEGISPTPTPTVTHAHNLDHLGTLRTIGYAQEYVVQRIEAFLAKPRHYLVDVRHKPYCAWDHYWDRDQLKKTYKRRYVHMPGLGNVNHTGKGKPIHLKDPEPHIQHLAERLLRGDSFLLLCGCKNYERCHRKVVADLIMDRLGLPHLSEEAFIAVSLWSEDGTVVEHHLRN